MDTEGMRQVSLRDLAQTIFMGANIGRLPKSLGFAPTQPLIHVRDIVESSITDVEKLEHIDAPQGRSLQKQILQNGDVLVSARGTLLKCAVISASHVGAIASANFIVIRLGNSPPLCPELLSAHLRQHRIQTGILNRISSTAQPALTIRDIENLSIPIPRDEIQAKLVRLLQLSEQQCRAAVALAHLRRDEAMDLVANHMSVSDER